MRDDNGAGIPRTRRGPAPKRGKFPAPVGERGGGGEKSPTRNGGGGGGKFPPGPGPVPRRVKIPVAFPVSRPACNSEITNISFICKFNFYFLKGI